MRKSKNTFSTPSRHLSPDSVSQLPERILNQISAGFIAFDKNARCIYVNKAASKTIHTEKSALLGLDIWDIFVSVKNTPLAKKITNSMGASKAVSGQMYSIRLNKWFYYRFYPTKETHILTFQDITDHKRIEEELRSNEIRYRTLIEKSFDAIVLLTKEGKRIYATPAISKVLGYASNENIGKDTFEKVHPDDKKYMKKVLAEVTKKPRKSITTEWRVLDKQNSYRWVEGTLSNFLDDPIIKAVIANYHDITDRKLYEEELLRSEERFRTLIQQSADAIQLLSAQGIIQYSSDSITRVVGYLPDELLGKKAAPFIHQDDKELFSKAYASLLKKPGNQVTLEYRVKHKNGSWIWIEATGVNHLHNPAIHAIVGNFRDITKRKLLEQQREEFLSIASHELKTPITSLKAFNQILQHTFIKSGNTKSAELLGKMDAQINRLTSLIQDLLDVSKIETGRLEFVNNIFPIDELVGEVVEDIERTSTKHTFVIKGKTGKKVYADRERISQVLTNFLTNAIKYSPKSKKIVIYLTSEKNEVQVTVKDFGMGIPENELPFVFDRFYRISGKSYSTIPGMGLGLNIAAEIIRNQSGRIWAKSSVGKGSKFSFSLPITHGRKKKNV